MTLSELKELAENATPGPWKADLGNWQIECDRLDLDNYRDGICSFTHDDRDGIDGRVNPINPLHDAEFIGAANPHTILDLIKRLELVADCLKEVGDCCMPDTAKKAISLCIKALEKDIK